MGTINWDKKEELIKGLIRYTNVLNPKLNIVNRLESILLKEDNSYNWRQALVGYNQHIPEHRNCVDFKYDAKSIEDDTSNAGIELTNIWNDCYNAQLLPVNDYSLTFNTEELRFWETMNFIKYGPGEHFNEHLDNGATYSCAVSLVAYLNDDYEGGELYFRTWGLTIKPKAGDLYIFPSNYMYPHQAMPVTSGTKYTIATMLDYSAKYHQPELYQETGN